MALLYTKDVVSVWIGTTDKNIEEFNKYVEGMDDHEADCPARREIGTIDFDYFVAYGTPDNVVIPVESLVKEADTYSASTDASIVETAAKLGVTAGNSLYTYRDATFVEEIPGKLYNDLRFIGVFSDPRKKKSRSPNG